MSRMLLFVYAHYTTLCTTVSLRIILRQRARKTGGIVWNLPTNVVVKFDLKGWGFSATGTSSFMCFNDANNNHWATN